MGTRWKRPESLPDEEVDLMFALWITDLSLALLLTLLYMYLLNTGNGFMEDYFLAMNVIFVFPILFGGVNLILHFIAQSPWLSVWIPFGFLLILILGNLALNAQARWIGTRAKNKIFKSVQTIFAGYNIEISQNQVWVNYRYKKLNLSVKVKDKAKLKGLNVHTIRKEINLISPKLQIDSVNIY